MGKRDSKEKRKHQNLGREIILVGVLVMGLLMWPDCGHASPLAIEIIYMEWGIWHEHRGACEVNGYLHWA